MKTCPILLSFALTCAATRAQFTYSIDDGEATVTEYDCGGSEAIIPDTFMGLPVTSIGNAAFSGCSNLTRVIIPNSVTRIEPVAFWGCSGLPSVTIPDSVTSIGWNVFEGCKSLTSVNIGKSVTTIGIGAFRYCTSLTRVTIPRSLTSIRQGLFWNCPNLTGVYFEGNAPEFYSENGGAFGDFVDSRSAAILYHRSEATGWGQRNGDRPTALWIDPPVYEEWIQGTRLPPRQHRIRRSRSGRHDQFPGDACRNGSDGLELDSGEGT